MTVRAVRNIGACQCDGEGDSGGPLIGAHLRLPSLFLLLSLAGCTAADSAKIGDRSADPSPDDVGAPADDEDRAARDDADPEDSGSPDDADTGSGDDGGAETGSAATVPGDVLDLTNWKLTLPFGDPGNPVEISQPELDTYAVDPYFRLAGDRVAFLANAGGVTTSGSHFPRSELREMTDGGAAKASWSTTSGVHTMTITEAVTHLPEVVPHVVAGQIHGDTAYVMLVRLDGNRLWVKSDGNDVGDLDPDYVLGTEFTVRIQAADGRVDVYYDDMTTPKLSFPYDATGCYFKAGAYAQSNTEYGDAPDDYAEVRIRSLEVTHE